MPQPRHKGRFFSLGAVRLWQYMRKHGLNQESFAHLLDVDSGTLFRWLWGERRPGLEVARRIQMKIGVPMDAWTNRESKSVVGFEPQKAA